MAPQSSIPTSANVLGTLGTICWCIQLVPQIYRNHRTRSTTGLPATMMFLWSACGVPFGSYAILQRDNVPIQVQPQCFCLLCLCCWAQCLVFEYKWRVWTTTVLTAAILLFYAGMEVLLVFVIRGPYSRGLEWPVTLLGVSAAVLLIVGYVPVPFEVMKRRGRVVGIDFLFLTIDWFGAFFSLMSIVAQNTFDPLFTTMYALCAAIEAGIFISQGVWLFRTRDIRHRAKESRSPWEMFPEAQDWEKKGWRRRKDWAPKFSPPCTTKSDPYVGHNDIRQQQQALA